MTLATEPIQFTHVRIHIRLGKTRMCDFFALVHYKAEAKTLMKVITPAQRATHPPTLVRIILNHTHGSNAARVPLQFFNPGSGAHAAELISVHSVVTHIRLLCMCVFFLIGRRSRTHQPAAQNVINSAEKAAVAHWT